MARGIFACVLLAIFRACPEPLIDCLADLLTDYSHGNKENEMDLLDFFDLLEGADIGTLKDEIPALRARALESRALLGEIELDIACMLDDMDAITEFDLYAVQEKMANLDTTYSHGNNLTTEENNHA